MPVCLCVCSCTCYITSTQNCHSTTKVWGSEFYGKRGHFGWSFKPQGLIEGSHSFSRLGLELGFGGLGFNMKVPHIDKSTRVLVSVCVCMRACVCVCVHRGVGVGGRLWLTNIGQSRKTEQ